MPASSTPVIQTASQRGDIEPTRIRRFLTFFKGYMSLSTIVVAALPVPVTMLHIIPTYSAQRGLLSVYTSLFCFLLVAFVFYLRHSLARLYFPRAPGPGRHRRSRIMSVIPLLFILLSIVLQFAYHRVLEISATSETRHLAYNLVSLSLNEFTSELEKLEAQGKTLTPEEKATRLAQIEGRFLEKMPAVPSADKQLKDAPLWDIPFGWVLVALYLGFFLSAEAAFVLMALREYLQELLGLSDDSLITSRAEGTTPPVDTTN